MATAHISGESLTAYQLRCNVCKQVSRPRHSNSSNIEEYNRKFKRTVLIKYNRIIACYKLLLY